MIVGGSDVRSTEAGLYTHLQRVDSYISAPLGSLSTGSSSH